MEDKNKKEIKKEKEKDIDEIIADNFFIAKQAIKEMSEDDKKDGD